MWQILGAGFLIWLANRLFSDSGEPTFKISKKSDCSNEFIGLAQNLDLTANKKRALKQAKDVIQQKIVEYFRGFEWKNGETIWKANPTFFIQGSYKHGTSIRTQQDVSDVDVGAYFEGKPPITPFALQQNLYKALAGHTSLPVSIKNKCVRVKYANLFHIDLPIYYRDKKTKKYFLGVKDQWIESDPKAFTEWVATQIKPIEQKLRIVRYFKAWSDNTRRKNSIKMPSGVAFTVWINAFYVKDSREDIAFIKTAYQILKHLTDQGVDNWKCEMPVMPFDNLISKLNDDQRSNFLRSLGELIKSSESILALEQREQAVYAWQKVFGKWFPEYNY